MKILLLFILLYPPCSAFGQCVPMMNDIRREIYSIQTDVRTAIHQQARDKSRIGWELLEKNKRGKAEKAFRRAVELNPDCWDALAGLAHLAYLCGHPKTGESLYQKSRNAFQHFRKNIPAATARLKQCRESLKAVLNRLDLHQAMYAIQEKGESYDPSHQEERVQSMIDRIDRNLKFFRNIARIQFPARLSLLHGNDLSRSGRWKAAETVYRMGIKAAPENALLHRNLAICLLALGRTKEAGKEACTAIQLGANFPEPLHRRLHLSPAHPAR